MGFNMVVMWVMMREVRQNGNDIYMKHEEGNLSEIGTWGYIHK